MLHITQGDMSHEFQDCIYSLNSTTYEKRAISNTHQAIGGMSIFAIDWIPSHHTFQDLLGWRCVHIDSWLEFIVSHMRICSAMEMALSCMCIYRWCDENVMTLLYSFYESFILNWPLRLNLSVSVNKHITEAWHCSIACWNMEWYVYFLQSTP